jgi:hypothetical protein
MLVKMIVETIEGQFLMVANSPGNIEGRNCLVWRKVRGSVLGSGAWVKLKGAQQRETL